MPLAPADLAAYANDVVGVFGSEPLFAPPGDAPAAVAIRARVCAVLGDLRPQADGLSVGEAVAVLLDQAGRGWPDRARASRMIAELQALFGHAAFRRTRRAERGRRFAQLVVLLELEPALGLPPLDATADPEQHLKRVRRRLREPG